MGKKKTRHHRKPRSIGGSDDASNISYVGDRKHKAWHLLFANYPAWKIATIINSTWLDRDWVFVPQLRKEHAARLIQDEPCSDPNQLEIDFP